MDHIQTRPPPPEDQPPMGIRLESSPQPLGWIAPALMALLHLVLWLPSLATFLVLGQRLKKIFADFQMKLPLATEMALAASDLLSAYSLILPVPILAFLAVDFLILYWLWRQARPWAWTWFVLLILLSMAALFWAWSALYLPLLTLMEDLARCPLRLRGNFSAPP